MKTLAAIGLAAREAAVPLSVSPTAVRNAALLAMAETLIKHTDALLAANLPDLSAARRNGRPEPFIERLTLTEKRVADMAQGLREVAALPDPLNRVLSGQTRPNGLNIVKVTAPLGVIGIIYESRPNVTADAAALCLKSGNPCILRGGSDALGTNKAIADLLKAAIVASGLPEGSLSLIEDTSRETALQLMQAREYLDVLIPRGGQNLIRTVVENARVPVIETGTGNCHVYVDGGCTDLNMALDIIDNAKTQRPSVCNAAETLLVDARVAAAFLPLCAERLRKKGVELRGCDRCRALVPDMKAATEEDYRTEYNALILAVKVVDGVDEAIAHINHYGTKHSEAICTFDTRAAEKFLSHVDAAAVYLNASTRFTDGGEFGFGAEIGISNQKLHARGPMGLEQLTTAKYIIRGDGQIR